MTLEDYIRSEYAAGKIDHVFRALITAEGEVQIYGHPLNRDGLTTPLLVVEGNAVRNKVWSAPVLTTSVQPAASYPTAAAAVDPPAYREVSTLFTFDVDKAITLPLSVTAAHVVGSGK